MKTLIPQAAAAGALFFSSLSPAAVTPVQENFGNVGPTLLGQSLNVFRSGDPAPWYVSFSLMTQSDVRLGALGLGAGSNGSFFDLTSIRIVTANGDNVAFGSDVFMPNPFALPIEALAVAPGLAAGDYALEVSGAGNRIVCTPYCGEAVDFTVRLQVTPTAGASGQVADVAVLPAQAAYGNVFPVLTEQSLKVFRNGAAAPTYVSFNLLAQADVALGTLGLGAGSNGSFFELNAIRLVDAAGRHIAFGTDVVPNNPFSQAIDELVVARSLPAGQYLLEVSGSGDRISCTPYCGDTADFAVRLQVTAVPEPAPATLLLSGVAAFAALARRRLGQRSGA